MKTASTDIPRGIDSLPPAAQREALAQVAALVADYLRGLATGQCHIRDLTSALPPVYGISKREVVYGVRYGLQHNILSSDSAAGPLRPGVDLAH